jgi:hypothetical protein
MLNSMSTFWTSSFKIVDQWEGGALQANFVPIYKVNKSWEVDHSHLLFHILYIERIFYELNLTLFASSKNMSFNGPLFS